KAAFRASWGASLRAAAAWALGRGRGTVADSKLGPRSLAARASPSGPVNLAHVELRSVGDPGGIDGKRRLSDCCQSGAEQRLRHLRRPLPGHVVRLRGGFRRLLASNLSTCLISARDSLINSWLVLICCNRSARWRRTAAKFCMSREAVSSMARWPHPGS